MLERWSIPTPGGREEGRRRLLFLTVVSGQQQGSIPTNFLPPDSCPDILEGGRHQAWMLGSEHVRLGAGGSASPSGRGFNEFTFWKRSRLFR